MEKEKLYGLGFNFRNGAYVLDLEYQGYISCVSIKGNDLENITIDEVKAMITKEMKELKDYVRRYAR